MSPFDALSPKSKEMVDSISAGPAPPAALCLRPTTLPPEALVAVMHKLKASATCVLANEQEYGTKALYVHTNTKLSDVLPCQILDALDVQPQRAAVYHLKEPYNAAQLQEALNVQAARHAGINAALVHQDTNVLTIFEDPISHFQGTWRASNSCQLYTVCLVFVSDAAHALCMVRIQGLYDNLQELEVIKQAIAMRPEFIANQLAIKSDGSSLFLQPVHTQDLPNVQRMALAVLQELGLRHNVLPSRTLLHFQRAHSVPHCGAEIDIWPAEDAGANYVDLATCDVVARVLTDLGCGESMCSQRKSLAFELGGVKCQKCAKKFATMVLERMPASLDCTELALSIARTTLFASTAASDVTSFLEHVREMLSQCGLSPTLVDEADVAEGMEPGMGLSHLGVVEAPDAAVVSEVQVRPGALACAHCTTQLLQTLPRALPLHNAAADPTRGTILVEYPADLGQEAVLKALGALGYAPELLESGAHLVERLHDLLGNPAPAPASDGEDTPGSEFNDSEPPSGLGAYTAKVYLALHAPPTTVELLLLPSGPTPGPGAEFDLFLRDSGGALTRVDPTGAGAPVYLENEYTIWYDKVVDRSKPNAPEGTLMELESFCSLQDFWRVWRQFDLASLQEGDVIMVFRRHVQPNIHHPVNKAGGRWYTRALPLETRGQLWTGLVLAMLGEFLEDNTNNEVCGVVLSVKPGGDRIEVWVDGDYHHHARHGAEAVPVQRQLSPTMGDILAKVLNLNPGRHRLHYWTHVAYERHRKLHSGSARRDKRKHKGAGPLHSVRAPIAPQY